MRGRSLVSNILAGIGAGSSMRKFPEGAGTVELELALRRLARLLVAVRGPFLTPHRQKIYIVDGCILTTSEILSLCDDGKTNEEVRKLLIDLKAVQIGEMPNQRRSERVMLKLRLLVRWEMPGGQELQTQASTAMVNAHGGLLECPFRMALGQYITLLNPQSEKEARCRVVRVQGPAGDAFTVAFEFEERSAWFWPVAFPPPDWVAKAEPA
jgi:hypothetical protein